MSREITWRDCVQACDELIDTFQRKMQEEPEHGWQKYRDAAMARREEFIILAKEQRIQEVQKFKQSLQKICDNVLEQSRGQLP